MRSLLVCVLGVAAMSACKSSDNPMNDLSADAGVDLSIHHDLSKIDGAIDLSMFDGADLSKLPDLIDVDMYTPLFKPAVNYAVETGPQVLVTGDFNKDNVVDLAVLNYNDPDGTTFGNGIKQASVTILLGNGDGTFMNKSTTQIPPFNSATSFAHSLVTNDVDQDTKPDVVISINKAVVVLLGNGDGTLQAPVAFAGGSFLRGIAIGDLSGDGKPDIVVSDHFDLASSYGKIQVFVGDGMGGFATPPVAFAVGQEVDTGLARFPGAIAIGDMNADGKNDVVTANVTPDANTNSLSILANTSTGGVTSFSTPVEIVTNKSPFSVLVAQLDGANKLDLVVANLGDDSLSVYLSDTAGSSLTFGTPTRYDLGVGSKPAAIAFADFDGDTKIDLVSANSNADSVTVLYGAGGGVFGSATTTRPGTESYSTGRNPLSVVARGFNADTKVDVATANQLGDNVSVLINQR